MDDTQATIATLEARVARMEQQFILLGLNGFMSITTAAKLLNKSPERLRSEIRESEKAAALRKTPKLKSGYHYNRVGNGTARPTYEIHLMRYQESKSS